MSIQQTAPEDKMTAASEGPWDFEPIPPDAHTDPDILTPRDERFWIVDRHGEVIAAVHAAPGRDAEAEANARLIGAAQRLLAELKSTRNLIADCFGPGCTSCLRLDAIIAAAEGR